MTDETFNSDSNRRLFRSLHRVLGRMRDLDKDMPVQQSVVLTWVALNEGESQRKLREDLDMPSSTTSRNLAALSKIHRLGKAGLGLIELQESPEDRRVKLLYLTPKGRQLIERMIDDLT